MDPRFTDIQNHPENEIFAVVFYPDRIYHAEYLNATRSSRYRYYVHEVRNKMDITVMKGQVFLDGNYLTNFVRIEYRAGRLVEQAREKERFLRDNVMAYLRLTSKDATITADGTIRLHFCNWINAYQVELWESLEPPATKRHDIKVQSLMGRDGHIAHHRQFDVLLDKIDDIKQVELAFSESDIDKPTGYKINNQQWDNDYFRSYQVPNTQTPSAPENTVKVDNYMLDFQRGWFFDDVGKEVLPVRYQNAMTEPSSADYRDPQQNPLANIIEMRWVLQREMGSSIVYFHEVTIPPGTVEGTHRHIGSEELYYIFEGDGIAYMGANDDPKMANDPRYPIREVDIFGIGKLPVREVAVHPRSVIYTKSGGIHGIRNLSPDKPLRFVAFGYHSA